MPLSKISVIISMVKGYEVSSLKFSSLENLGGPNEYMNVLVISFSCQRLLLGGAWCPFEKFGCS